jgi:hypothetical protein
MTSNDHLPADRLDCPQHGRQRIDGWAWSGTGTAADATAHLACGCELPDPHGPDRVLRAYRDSRDRRR